MYESPINIQELTRDIQEKIKQDQEEKVMECICEYGINVDKEELIKALQYDRNQYKKGFAEALDKIRAEIDRIYEREGNSSDCLNALDDLKWFINKCNAESEDK